MLIHNNQIVELSIADLLSKYKQGQLSVLSFVESSLERIERLDRQGPTLNAMIAVANDAQERANALDRELADRGSLRPLHGVPIVIKDNINVMGFPTTGGCAALCELLPKSDARVVERLKKAGAIILGKSSMSEFAWGMHDTENSVIQGPTRNPYNYDYAAGGSSGGTGVAIAAGYCVAGLGTDTGCSVRAPSSINGLVGLRPTHGLIEMDGVMPMNADWDTVGPMTRTVTDLAIILDAMTGESLDQKHKRYTQQLTDRSTSEMRVGVLRQLAKPSDSDTRVIELLDAAVSDLESIGVKVIDPIETNVFTLAFDAFDWYLRFRFDLDGFLKRMGAHSPARSLEEILQTGMVLDRYVDELKISMMWPYRPEEHPRLKQMHQIRDQYRYAFMELMSQSSLDALIFPTFRFPPVLNARIKGQQVGSEASVGSNNHFASLTGFPALNVPMGFVGSGLPVGLQLLGRPYSEASLLQVGYGYEQFTQHRLPPHLSQ